MLPGYLQDRCLSQGLALCEKALLASHSFPQSLSLGTGAGGRASACVLPVAVSEGCLTHEMLLEGGRMRSQAVLSLDPFWERRRQRGALLPGRAQQMWLSQGLALCAYSQLASHSPSVLILPGTGA